MNSTPIFDLPNITREAQLGFLLGGHAYRLIVEGDQETWSTAFDTPSSSSTWAVPEAAGIYPGVQYDEDSAISHCTGGWIVRDATNATVYQLTAGHCYFDTGDNVVKIGGQRIGTVRAHEYLENATSDWALVEIDPSARHLVSPSLKHWGGPIGLVEPNAPALGNPLCWYGNGDIFVDDAIRHRCGRLRGFQSVPWVWWASGTVFPGDSGAPVIHIPSGGALGILQKSFGPYLAGTTVCQALERAQEAIEGHLGLVSAPLNPAALDLILDPDVPYGIPLMTGLYGCPDNVLTNSRALVFAAL